MITTSIGTEGLPVLPWKSKPASTITPQALSLKLGLTGLLASTAVYVITENPVLTTIAAAIMSGISIYWLKVNNPERLASYKFKMQEAIYSGIKDTYKNYRLADHEIEAIMESEAVAVQARMASYLSFDDIRIKNAAKEFADRYTSGWHVDNYVRERKKTLNDVFYGLIDSIEEERQFEKNSTILNFRDWIKSIERSRTTAFFSRLLPKSE